MHTMKLAKELDEARKARATIPAFAGRIDDLDRESAYAVQEAGIELRRADGETVIGGKLGFTSKAMQRAMSVPSPNYGWLTDAMVRTASVSLRELIHPKVEPEIAFLLGADLDRGDASGRDVLAATVAVAPCLEIVDSRFHDFRFGPLDNIADNSSAAQVVLGEWRDVPASALAKVGVVLYENEEPVMTAAGAAALDDPVEAVAWMAREVASGTRPLLEGDIVISGGLTSPLDLAANQNVRVEIDRVGSSEFEVRS